MRTCIPRAQQGGDSRLHMICAIHTRDGRKQSSNHALNLLPNFLSMHMDDTLGTPQLRPAKTDDVVSSPVFRGETGGAARFRVACDPLLRYYVTNWLVGPRIQSRLSSGRPPRPKGNEQPGLFGEWGGVGFVRRDVFADRLGTWDGWCSPPVYSV